VAGVAQRDWLRAAGRQQLRTLDDLECRLIDAVRHGTATPPVDTEGVAQALYGRPASSAPIGYWTFAPFLDTCRRN